MTRDGSQRHSKKKLYSLLVLILKMGQGKYEHRFFPMGLPNRYLSSAFPPLSSAVTF